MKELKLSNGTTLVDDDVFEWASKFHWCIGSKGDVQRSGQPDLITNKRKTIILHRLINKTPKHLHTDHINGQRQDNRRCNLRTVTNQQNHQNSRPQKGASSKYKGVSFERNSRGKKKWKAYIKVEGKLKNLGRFQDQESAAKVYNKAALKYFGEYAWLNNLEQEYQTSH